MEELLRRIERAVQANDRGYLAELRRGMSSTTQMQAWEHIVPFCKGFEDDAIRTIWCSFGGCAALIIQSGLNTSEPPWYNFGSTMRAIARGSGSGSVNERLKSFEPKFRRLLSCHDVMNLCEMVVGIVRTAESLSVKVNLKKLFWDLMDWRDAEKREKAKLRWAEQYFRVEEDS